MIMEHSILIAGSGGQGIMLIGKLLSYAAIEAGKEATFYPAYGAEMRGGTANCTVVISDEEISSPILERFTTIIALNEPSYIKFHSQVIDGGNILINSSLIASISEELGKKASVYAVPVNNIALELGSEKISNIVLIGAYIGITEIIDPEVFRNTIRKMLYKDEELMNLNLIAFDKGLAAGQDFRL